MLKCSIISSPDKAGLILDSSSLALTSSILFSISSRFSYISFAFILFFVVTSALTSSFKSSSICPASTMYLLTAESVHPILKVWGRKCCSTSSAISSIVLLSYFNPFNIFFVILAPTTSWCLKCTFPFSIPLVFGLAISCKRAPILSVSFGGTPSKTANVCS